jgi:hypothetical protein
MLSTIFEKIARGQKIAREEEQELIDWAQRAESMATSANPSTGRIATPAPHYREIYAMVDDIIKGRQVINKLSDVSNQMGLQIAGEFRTGNGQVPGDGFTGGRFGWPGFTYGGTEYFLAGVLSDVLQVGLSLADGKVYAGEGNVVLTDAGIVIKAGDGSQSFLSFYNAAGTVEQFAFKTTNGNMQILNQVSGATTLISSLLSDASSPDIIWGEHDSIAGVSRLQVNASSVAPTLALFGGSGIALWANSNGKETVFNDTSYDIDFRVEGATNPYVFFVDAGNDRVEFKNASGTAVHIINPTGTTYFNENNGNVDFIVEGQNNGKMLVGDADANRFTSFAWNGWESREFETWTRTGNHTFTLPGDVTSEYRKGTKVQYSDGAVDYAVIGSSSHAAGTTTVNLIPNTDYTMAAATITGNYISHIENPRLFPHWFNFDAAPSGFSAVPASPVYQWRTQADVISIAYIELSAGTSNATTFGATAPIAPAQAVTGVAGTLVDNGALLTAAGRVTMTAGSTAITFRSNMSTGAWTNANGKRAVAYWFYAY